MGWPSLLPKGTNQKLWSGERGGGGDSWSRATATPFAILQDLNEELLMGTLPAATGTVQRFNEHCLLANTSRRLAD